MGDKAITIDDKKARELVERGRRSKWWRRRGSMKSGFWYVDADGKRITKKKYLEKIKGLVIPPAWKHVRISPSMKGKLQAVGIDTSGRVQYLYDQKFAEKRQRQKFAKIIEFGHVLPKLRKQTNSDLELEGFPREKVLAIMMRLINSLYMRMGTENSAKRYRTYGITTLENRHLKFGDDGELVFEFVGKSHIKQRLVMVDDGLAALMRELKDFGAAKKLFHYLDEEGKPRAVKPAEVNRYIKEATAPEYSSKDLRTWGATLLAAIELAESGVADDVRSAKQNIVEAVKRVAEQLGNTPAVCRGSYIHPRVLKSYEKGITLEEFRPPGKRRITRIQDEYDPEERALLRLLASS